MGGLLSICSNAKEPEKQGLLSGVDNDDNNNSGVSGRQLRDLSTGDDLTAAESSVGADGSYRKGLRPSENDDTEFDEATKRQREEEERVAAEQLRLEEERREEMERVKRIVLVASQDMIPVGRRDASSFDPSFVAAAISQNNAQAMLFAAAAPPSVVRGKLPRTAFAAPSALAGEAATRSEASAIVQTLSRGIWDDVPLRQALQRGDGSSDVVPTDGGQSLSILLDDTAEAFLTKVDPTREKLFQGCRPIAENLP